jgi:hypothetical protein
MSCDVAEVVTANTTRDRFKPTYGAERSCGQTCSKRTLCRSSPFRCETVLKALETIIVLAVNLVVRVKAVFSIRIQALKCEPPLARLRYRPVIHRSQRRSGKD